jgi:hypothetical protein
LPEADGISFRQQNLFGEKLQMTIQVAPASKRTLWTGRILSSLPRLLFVFTGTFGWLKPALAAPGFAHYGYPDGGLLRVAQSCMRSRVRRSSARFFGAILMTGLSGGSDGCAQ